MDSSNCTREGLKKIVDNLNLDVMMKCARMIDDGYSFFRVPNNPDLSYHKNPELKQYSNEVLRTHARKKDMDNSKLGAKKVKWTEDEEEILVEAVYKLNDTSPAKIERFCGERLTRNQQQIQDKIKSLMMIGKIDIQIESLDSNPNESS